MFMQVLCSWMAKICDRGPGTARQTKGGQRQMDGASYVGANGRWTNVKAASEMDSVPNGAATGRAATGERTTFKPAIGGWNRPAEKSISAEVFKQNKLNLWMIRGVNNRKSVTYRILFYFPIKKSFQNRNRGQPIFKSQCCVKIRSFWYLRKRKLH